MKPRLTNQKPPLSADELKSVEARLGVSFPKPYRDFILKHNGGKPEPNLFSSADGGGSFVQEFLAIHNGLHDNLEDYFHTFKVARRAMPDNVMPIAHDGFGNQVCISTAGDDCGSVYFWDHETAGRRASYKNLHLIASNFDDFLGSLYEKPVQPLAELIHRVFQKEEVEALDLLIAAGWDVNSGPYRPDIPALELASTYNMIEITRVLLQHGARLGRALEMVRRFAVAFPDRDYSKIIALLEGH